MYIIQRFVLDWLIDSIVGMPFFMSVDVSIQRGSDAIASEQNKVDTLLNSAGWLQPGYNLVVLIRHPKGSCLYC